MLNYDQALNMMNEAMTQIIMKAEGAKNVNLRDHGYPDMPERWGYYPLDPSSMALLRESLLQHFTSPMDFSLSGRWAALQSAIYNTDPSNFLLTSKDTKHNNEFLAFLDHYTQFFMETEQQFRQQMIQEPSMGHPNFLGVASLSKSSLETSTHEVETPQISLKRKTSP